jgi:hypothetical protein
MIKYEFEGTEALQRQIDLLKFYPEIFDKHFYPALEVAGVLTREAVRPNLPVHTGKLSAALGSRTIHSGTSALGTRADIGFGKRYGKPSAPYAAALNAGPVAHEVAGRRREDKQLRFSSGGRYTSIGSIQHPGFAGFQFMEKGLADAMPGINTLIDQASNKVVAELAKP